MSVFSSYSSASSQVRSDIVAGAKDPKSAQILNHNLFSGMPYKGSRKGDQSILDGDLHKIRAEEERKKIGAGGYRVAYLSNDGKPMKNYPVEVDGEAILTNDLGQIYYVDEEFIDKEYEMMKHFEDKIKGLAKKARTDGILQTMLGISYAELKSICCSVDNGGSADPMKKIGITNADLQKLSCLPSEIVLYPIGSMTEAQAFQKLCLVIKAFLPAIKKSTRKNVDKAPVQTTDDVKESNKAGPAPL